MKAIKRIEKIREYCDYLEDHINNVAKAWEILKKKCVEMSFIKDDDTFCAISKMIDLHDNTKLSDREFIQYQRKFFSVGFVNSEDDRRFTDAWNHHVRHNPHHWENWTLIAIHDKELLKSHCVCMICDWMAMGMKFGDTAQEYYEKNSCKIQLPDWAITFIYEIFNCLKKEK